MMQSLRENTKIILWVVVVAFIITIFAVWGLDLQTAGVQTQQSMVGRVAGEAVTAQAYQQIYSQLAQQFRAQSGGELTAAQQEMVREQAWENLVSSVLTTKEIEKLGITVSDEEILTFLRTSPPPEVQQYFRDQAGNFDFAAYQSALSNPEADWSAVEDLARQRIPIVKLNLYLMSQVHVSNTEVRRAFDEENVKMVAEFVQFPIDGESVGDRVATDAEIQAYYDKNKDRFQQPETAVLEFVRIPITPSAQDKEDLILSAEHIASEAANDFADAAKTYSETHTAAVGGETGFLSRNQRDEAVMAAAEALKPGQISAPIPTAEGVYLVQLIATRKEKGETQINMREIFMKLTAGTATVDTLSGTARDIQGRATENGDLTAAARVYNLEAQTSQPFTRMAPVPGLGFVPAASRFAFANEAGKVSGVINDDNNFYVCKVVSRTPASATPLAEVTETIKQDLVRQYKLESAMHKAEAFRRSAAIPNVPFAQAAKQYGYTVAKSDSFTVSTPPVGHSTAFARAALSTEVGSVTPGIESGNSVYVIHVLGRREGELAVYKVRGPQLLDQLRSQKIQEYVMHWYETLKEKNTVEDFRETMQI